MHLLDGSAGGGQLVRTALTLSAVTNEPFRMRHVRRARSNPGLQAQHCAAVETVAAACDAETENVEVGAEEFRFEPYAGDEEEEDAQQQVSVEVGTAGSVPLVFDALLPIGVALDEPFTAHLTGGTDAKWAPPFDYFQHVKFPILEAHGVDATVATKRRGFYPRGGGKASLTVQPFSVSPLDLTERGERTSLTVHSVAEESFEEDDVAQRQADAATEGVDGADESVSYVEADCPGSAVVLDAEYEHSRAGFAALGERGKPAEEVGEEAATALTAFEDGGAAVDEHLADQLVPYLALAGGEVRAPRVTNHIETAVDLVEEFGYEVTVEDDGDTVLLSG